MGLGGFKPKPSMEGVGLSSKTKQWEKKSHLDFQLQNTSLNLHQSKNQFFTSVVPLEGSEYLRYH